MFSGIEAKFDENKKIYIYIFHPSPQIYSSFLEEKNFGKFRRKIKLTRFSQSQLLIINYDE